MNSKFLFLNSRDDLYRVDIDTIVYFESDGNYTSFVLGNKVKGMVGMNLTKMQKVLDQNLQDRAALFVRVGKRFIVNVNYIYHIELVKQKLTLSDGRTFAYQLPVSKDALRKLKDLYINSIIG